LDPSRQAREQANRHRNLTNFEQVLNLNQSDTERQATIKDIKEGKALLFW
jgi:hypothetical protein